MKFMRTIGLLVFFIGFALFNSTFFLETYKMPLDISTVIHDEEKRDAFMYFSSSMNPGKYQRIFSFERDIQVYMDSVNESALETYSLEDDLPYLKNLFTSGIDLSRLGEVYNEDDAIGSYKIKAIKDYGGWLDGRLPGDESELMGWLRIVNDNIRKYGIIADHGFDKYQQKDIRYGLARIASSGPVSENPLLFLFLTVGLMVMGGIAFIVPSLKLHKPGIRNTGIFQRLTTNGSWLGIVIGSYLILFYLVLYYFHEYMTAWIIMVDPVSYWLKGAAAGQFFLYGFLYTLVIIVMGIRMLIKYRHSKYQVIRTFSVMFFQTAFAFLIPEILLRLNQPHYDFKNIWPLDYDFFFNTEIDKLVESGGLGVFMLIWGIILILFAVPVLVYFYGKRWYCSWVCGCGGLAETAGDPYRQLSNNSLKAWKIERYMIHGVLVFAIIMTAGVLYTYFTGVSDIAGVSTYTLRETYGLWIGAGFAGVVGTGFYPFMGNRVWCRFGCPLAAYLGFVQRFKSRFRITTNGGQCISCGNCSTYCEMGIDVRWYAQRGQNIVRSSCVGCGICSEVCPRGVLNLELSKEQGRFGKAELPG